MSTKDKLLASAQKYLQKGQIAKAIQDYQRLVKLDPRDIRTRQKMAELCSRARMIPDAIEQYSAVARHYAENGFYLKAIAVFKQMQKLEPEQVDVYHHLAELNVKQGLIGNALAEYRSLVAFLEKKGMNSEVIGVLRKMTELDPENVTIPVRIAERYAKAGLLEEARAEIDQVRAGLEQSGDFDRVVRLFEIFIPHFPDDQELEVGLAQALISKGEVGKGIKLLKNMLREDPEDNSILRILARGYRLSGDFENQRLTLQHLLKSTPGDLDLREGYVRACLDGEDFQRALDEIEQWKEAFFDAGRSEALKDFSDRLSRALPGNEQLRKAFAGAWESSESGEGRSGREPEEAAKKTVSDGGEGTVGPAGDIIGNQPESVIEETPEPEQEVPESENELEGAEEIPLGFLEDAAYLDESDTAASATNSMPETSFPEEGADAEAVEELDPKFALDLDLELELEVEIEDPLLASAVHPYGEPEDATDAVPETFSARPGETSDEAPPVDVLGGSEEDAAAAGDFYSIGEEGLGPLPLSQHTDFFLDGGPSGGGPASEPFALDAPGLGEEPIEELWEETIEELDEEVIEELEEEILEELDQKALVGEFDSRGEDLRGELEEAEFYLQQGLLEEAERVCLQLLKIDPECTGAQRKLAEIEASREEVRTPVPVAGVQAPQEVPEEGILHVAEGLAGLEEADLFRLDGIFSEFKKGVETQLEAEDTETHYNLGIAYKEMGLLDDAVAEFDKAMMSPGRMVDCLTLKGVCLTEKGAFEQAEEAYLAGLAYPGLGTTEQVSINYEMGLLYESWGKLLEALDNFQYVADADLFFRNVGEKIKELRKELGLDPSGEDEDPGAKGSKNRVSYV